MAFLRLVFEDDDVDRLEEKGHVSVIGRVIVLGWFQQVGSGAEGQGRCLNSLSKVSC